ncbi:cytochrome P450 [Streptomyces sp. NPDC050560]|uniref:cytochrome P450 n=1 Tax=Streptomyces sp. NPDC050560 TaxID=3365630 RepID=UPI0037B57486
MTSRVNPATLVPGDPGERDRPVFQFSRMESLLRGHRLRRLTVDGVDAVFVRDPVLVRRILVSESKNYGKGELFRKARNLSRVGMLSEDETMHRHYRRLVNPYLRSSKVGDYLPTMRHIVRDMVSSWRPGDTVDVQSEMCRIACAIAVGTLIVGLPADTTKELGERLARLAGEMIRKPLYGKAAHRTARPGAPNRLSRARKEFRDLLRECIADPPEAPAWTNGYLSTLLTDSDEQGNRVLTPDEVCEEAVMMLTSATVTTASVMSWALHVLSRNPLAEERLLKDLTERRGGGATHDHTSSYTVRFLMEIMRLYPPVWISCRKTLAEVELGDQAIPAGTNVVFSSYLLHRDNQSYPNPHQFDPDRWLSVQLGKIEAAYIPFGIGSKGCIGEPFAWLELEVILDVVTQEWKLNSVPDRQFRTAPETTLHPRRLHLVSQPR